MITSASTFALSTNAVAIGVSSVQAGAGVTPGNYTVSVLQATAGATRTGTSPLAASTVIDGTQQHAQPRARRRADTGHDRVGHLRRGRTPRCGQDRPRRSRRRCHCFPRRHRPAPPHIDPRGLRARRSRSWAAAAPTVRSVSPTSAPRQAPTERSRSVPSPPSRSRRPAPARRSPSMPAPATSTSSSTAACASATPRSSWSRTGDRSLASVAAAINGANAGANAAAIKVADGAWILQLSSSRSGTDNAMALDATVFAGVGGLLQTSGAQDAQITIGTGPGAYSVAASGNTFTDVLQRSDAHRHRRVGDACHRQREPRRRCHRGRRRATHRRRQQPAGRHQAADRATTRRPRPLRR